MVVGCVSNVNETPNGHRVISTTCKGSSPSFYTRQSELAPRTSQTDLSLLLTLKSVPLILYIISDAKQCLNTHEIEIDNPTIQVLL